MRDFRRGLTTQNIQEACTDNPEFVFEAIEEMLDNPDYDIPDEGPTISNIQVTINRQAYYGNLYPFLVNLWGIMRLAAAENKEARRMAMRDYLEKAASACKVKYEGSSRVLTGYQEIMRELRERSV